MMKKRIAAVGMVLFVTMTQLCAFASSYTTYSVHEGNAAVSDVSAADVNITIPQSFGGAQICGVGADAFKDNKTVQNVILPETVIYIEWGAFEGCIELKNIHIPENVAMIEDMTFAGCVSLADIELPLSLKSIGVKAFADTALTSVDIPDGALAIDIKAFADCEKLTSVTIPDSVIYIGEDAFENCGALTIKCLKGSYAENYARTNGIAYECIK